MRSNEERIAEVKRRIEKREREERLHRSRITGICAVAASLVLIICLSFFIPDAASRSRNNSYSNYDMAASCIHSCMCTLFLCVHFFCAHKIETAQ